MINPGGSGWDTDRRVLSDRQRSAGDRLDASPARRAGTPTFAGQVYNGGAMPTTVPAWYLTHPVEFDCPDAEGQPCTEAADASLSVPVIVLGQPPSVGDILIAEMVGGKWVAERGGGPCNPQVCVVACGSHAAYGATVTLFQAGRQVATATTSASGCITFVGLKADAYTVQVSVSGTVVYSATRTLSCSQPTTVSLGSNSGFVCCGPYAIPSILTLTGPGGTTPFVFDPNYYYPIWTGGYAVQALSSTVTTPNNTCIVAAPTQGPVRICYQMICHGDQNPTFAIQRSWSWVYQPGTLTPIWYQDPTGFAPGQLCFTAPPAICGNPLTDTASFGANPSSTSPFAISGTPVDANSNATADPDAGTVVISA